MRLKIRCDGESWKILGFWVEVNKARNEITFKTYKSHVVQQYEYKQLDGQK